MNQHVPDAPWSYYHPSECYRGEPDVPDTFDCGHSGNPDEATELPNGDVLCVNCAQDHEYFRARNPDHARDFHMPETDNPNEERTT